jgi:hypothetical protein
MANRQQTFWHRRPSIVVSAAPQLQGRMVNFQELDDDPPGSAAWTDATDFLPTEDKPAENPIIDIPDSDQSKFETTRSYYTQTRLADGRPALVIDPAGVGSLGGDAWAKVAIAAARHGHTPWRGWPLLASGVGNVTQVCDVDDKLPAALRQADGRTISVGHIATPTVTSSTIPGLWGLTALRKNRAIIDLSTLELYVCGPGD